MGSSDGRVIENACGELAPKAITAISGFNPMIAALLQQPQAAKALLEKWVYLYDITDKQAFLSNQTLQLAMQQLAMQQQMQMGGPGGATGMADGAPPMPGGNPPSGAVDPGRQLPQERRGVN